MTPAPPVPFPAANRFILPAGTVLHRIHARAYASDEFNPGRGRPSRFAPLLRPGGSDCIPTAYAAGTLECAAHETVFHDIPHDARRKMIDVETIHGLDHATIAPARHLTLCQLFEPDLNAWGLSRRDLIDTYPTQYVRTAAWAVAIHDAHADLDGLVWTSRRCDPVLACVLFGDRLGAAELTALTRQPIGTTPALMSALHGFARRAGITLVV